MAEVGKGLGTASDLILRIREFTLTTYNNLPNTLFITSLLMGAIQGNLPMIWVALGFVINAGITGVTQELLGLLFPKWNQIHQTTSPMCTILPEFSPGAAKPTHIVTPSMWFSATTYFVTFIFYNAAQVAMRPAAASASAKRVDARIAFSMSVILLSIFFFFLILLRGFTGCETWFGSIFGIVLGSSFAIGYWELLNVCGSGIPPDILNVVAATAPESSTDPTPVICTS